MKVGKRVSKKSLIFFILVFITIVIIHTVQNVIITTRQPCPDWSRSYIVGATSFNRPSIPKIENNNILVFYPSKNGKKEISAVRFDMNLKLLDEYNLYIDNFDFNVIRRDDVKLIDHSLYWRDDSNNIVYRGIFNENFKEIKKVEKLFENVNSFDILKEDEKVYAAVADTLGNVVLFSVEEDGITRVAEIDDINNIIGVILLSNQDKIYIQSVQQPKDDSLRKYVYVTEYFDGVFSESIKLNEVLEISNRLVGTRIGIDKNYVYSIAVVQGQNQGVYLYYIDGYDKFSKEIFNSIILKNDIPKKIYSLTSLPIILNTNDDGIEVITTSNNSLDVLCQNSNVVRLIITPEGIEDAKLLSNTNSWSSNPVLLRNNELRYVFWNEPGGFDKTYIKVASNNSSVINLLNKVEVRDVLLGLSGEIPNLSYLFIIAFGARLIPLLPSAFYLLFLFMFNEMIRNKKKVFIIIGFIIFLVFQLISMDFYYGYLSIAAMPKILKLSGVKYLIPIIFTGIGIIGARLFSKEKEVDAPYKIYIVFLLFAHILMNFLYTPYLI